MTESRPCGFSSGDVGLSSRRVLGVERFEEIVQQAMALLTELLAGKALLGIKDPRMPRLMPIWQAAFDAWGYGSTMSLRLAILLASRSLLLPVTT